MKKISRLEFRSVILVFSLILLSVLRSGAQQTSHCPNADFEFNNFTNWQGYTGTFPQLPNVPTPGIVPGRHTILAAPQGIDPNTCGGLQISPAFVGGYVCRLGNSSTGAQTERLVYTMVVDNQNALFAYRYAVVLQDPGHPIADQPQFRIQVTDSLGNIIDPVCGQYFVQAGQGIPGFQSCGQVVWKDWSTVGINLTPYIGQTVRIEFTTADCAQGGHFGYAYIDCFCMPAAIQSEFCVGANYVVLSAPPGFLTYHWDTGPNDTLQTDTVHNPTIGDTVVCQLTTVQNCNLTLTTYLNTTIVTPAYTTTFNPCNTTVQFNDFSQVINGQLDHWFWDFGDLSTSTSQSPSHTYANPGTYVVTLHAYSVTGCEDSISTVITLFAPPSADFSTDSVCIGDATSFTDMSLVVGDTINSWSWNFGDSGTDNSQNPQHTYASAGSFTATLIIGTVGGCHDTISHTVIVHANPVVQTLGNPTVCLGDSAQLTAVGAVSYVWTPSLGLSDSTANPVMGSPPDSTTYTVTGTDVHGCTATATATINVNPHPLVANPPAPHYCFGSSDTVCITGANSYHWSPPTGISWANGPDSSCVIVNSPVDIDYSVTGSSLEGCTASINIHVTVHPLPVASISPDGPISFCQGGSVNLTELPNGMDTVIWSTSATTQTIPVNYGGTFTVYVVDHNGCSDVSDPLTVTVFPNPVAVITPTGNPVFCAGDSVILCANPGMSLYNWSSSESTQCITVMNSGTFTVHIQDTNGCTDDSDPFTVTVNANPVAVITPSGLVNFCAGGSVDLSANSSMSHYSWMGSSTDTVQTITVNSSGTFTVHVEDANGCVDNSDPITVTVYPLPTPVITPDGPTSFCLGGSVHLTASGGTTYYWPAQNDSNATIMVNSTGTYVVNVWDSHGCPGTTQQNVTVNNPPVATVTPPGPVNICSGNPAVLTASPSGTGYTYQWYNSAGQITGATGETYTATVNNSYHVVVTDSNGCVGTSNIVVVTLGAGPTVTIQASPTIGCLLNTIYIGYGPQCVTLNAIASAGAVHYQWYLGSTLVDTLQSICVNQPGSYSVIAFDANWCPSPQPAVLNPPINVIDIRCGHGLKKITLCHVPEGNQGNPQTLCIAPPAVPPHLSLHRYDCLGPCSLYYRDDNVIDAGNFYVLPHPNPFNSGFSISILSSENSAVTVNVHDVLGRVVETYNNVNENTVMGIHLSMGIYYAEVIQGNNRQMIQVVKSE